MPERHEIRLASGTVQYEVAGTGRPLLYLHPAGGIRWTRPLAGLAATHRVVIPVQPGFDGTDTHEAVKTMRTLASLMGEFADAVIGGRCDVVGASFGGWVSAWLAVLRPDLVDHLVLQCPAGFRPEGQGSRPMTPEELRRGLFLYPEKLPPSPKTIEMEAANRRMLTWYGATIATDAELLARLPEVDKPTLLLHGTADTMVPASSVQLLARTLPRSYLVYVYDSAHSIEVDQPERCQALIADFLERSEAFVVNNHGRAA